MELGVEHLWTNIISLGKRQVMVGGGYMPKRREEGPWFQEKCEWYKYQNL